MIPQLQREVPVAPPGNVVRWSLATRVAFRFALSYLILYVYPRALGSLGKGVNYNNPLRDMWHAVVPWVGTNVLHLSGDFKEVANGSGDQLYDYVLLFCITVAAALATLLWSWLDRRRPNYELLYQWMRIFVRIMVAVAMISYGTNKLWLAQFPAPHLTRLLEPYGQTNPADLLWTMMGMSRGYSLFGGLGEMLGAVLLLVPWTTTLGSLVTIGVMSNVLMLNMGYDVPRKIYSIHLIAMCCFLLLPDMKRLLDFFLFNRQVQLTKPVALFKDKFMNRGALALQLLIAIGALAICSQYSYDVANDAMLTLSGPIRGIWTVNQITVDGAVRPPMVTDAELWRRVIIDRPYYIAIQPMDGPMHRYGLKLDTAKKSLMMWKPDDQRIKGLITYDLPQPDRLTLDGELNGHKISAKLSRMDTSDPINFALTTRGFHWINQYMHWINQMNESWR